MNKFVPNESRELILPMGSVSNFGGYPLLLSHHIAVLRSLHPDSHPAKCLPVRPCWTRKQDSNFGQQVVDDMKKSTASFSYVYILTILTDYQKQRTAVRGGKDPHAGVMLLPHTSLMTHLLLALQHQIISPGASIERRRQLTRRTTAIGECLHFSFLSFHPDLARLLHRLDAAQREQRRIADAETRRARCAASDSICSLC
jgi:hypothetical protein